MTIADALKALREDIQAEDTLIASRVTWYVTSQAFLLTAYATSWNAGFVWPYFFHKILPIVGTVVSVIILLSVFAATWAQDVYLREQHRFVEEIKNRLTLTEAEIVAISAYEKTMISNRTNKTGKVVGGKIHALVRVTPLILPVGFSALWLYAIFFGPKVI